MRIKTAKAVVEVMKEQGSNVVFGIPGGQTLFVTDEMLQGGVNFIQTRHEGAAGHAADAWGRMTGTPGICLATTGPGATNLITPIGGALRDSSPLIAMLFQNNLPHVGRGDAQEADHAAIFSSIVKEVISVRSPESVVWAVRHAYQVALSGRPGPVVLDFYRDVIEKGECDYTPADPATYVVPQASAPLSAKVAEAAALIRQSKKLCVYCGNGVKNAAASDKVLALAEKLNAPVVTSFNGIGSVPGTHELVYGARSRHGSTLTRGILEDADCVLVLGSSLSAVATNRWTVELKNIIQVDFDSSNIAKQYPVACGVVGDIAATLDALLEALGAPQSDVASARAAWIAELNAARKTWASKVFSGAINDSAASPAAPVALMRELDALLQENTTLSVDAGNPGAWSHLLHTRPGMRYMKPVNFGNMAFSIPGGIAAALAYPERDVLCMLGDGSLGMNLGELETAARSGANMTILVLNDNAYGNIKQEELYKFNAPRYVGVDFNEVDFAGAAKAMGCGGETINTAAELAAAVQRGRAHKGTYLIDVKFDGSYTVWPEAF